MAQADKLQLSLPFPGNASSVIFYPSVDLVGAAHDIDAFCRENQLQRNLKGTNDIKCEEMPDDAALGFSYLEILWQVKGKDKDIGKSVLSW